MAGKRGIIHTLSHLTGNAKACVWTEWMWGVPNTLYAAYTALYMQELGLSLTQIGYISSITLAMQIVSALLSGVVCDKLGRRLTTFLFDCISWSIPELLWMFSGSFSWFVAAALFNGLWRITGVSFELLMVEDAEHEQLVSIFSLSQLMGLLAAFFAPISKLCVDQWGVVPTMRVMYGVAFLLMTSKFFILFFCCKETERGKLRMRETKGVSVWKLLWDCRKVFWNLMKSKEMLLTIAILVAFNTATTLNANFWSVIVTTRLGIAKSNVSLFAMLKAFAQLSVIFFIVPRISASRFRTPMLVGWLAFAASQLILVLTPAASSFAVPALIGSVLLEALAISGMYPVMTSLLFINADPNQRARILGMVYAVMLLFITAFPSIAGALSEWDVRGPLYINLALFATGAALTCALWSVKAKSNTNKGGLSHGVSR